MAGNYPDVPDTRIALDKIGAQIYGYDGTTMTDRTATSDLVGISDEAFGGSGYTIGTTTYMFIYLPYAMDITACLAILRDTGFSVNVLPVKIETSPDTTNGLDGTWTSRTVGSSLTGSSYAEICRQSIVSGSWSGIRGIRVYGQAGAGAKVLGTLHLFGKPTSASGDRLEIWHPTTDTRLTGAALDWGNVPRSSTADLTFRVKNVSATKTANGVSVGLDALTDASPSVPGQHTLSIGGGSYGATAAVGTLAPGAISGVITLRRTTPSTATLGPWTARVLATATSFT